MLRLIVTCTVWLTIAASLSDAGEAVRIGAIEAAAVSRALHHFTTDYPQAKLHHFSVYLERLNDERIEITFVPKPEPRRRDKLELKLGGRNKYGEEVHYELALPSLRVIRKWYGR